MRYARGGAETPRVWDLCATDVEQNLVQVSYRNLRATPLSHGAIAHARAMNVRQLLGSDTLVTLRTYGSYLSPECGFNAIFGGPSQAGAPLRCPGIRDAAVDALDALRAEYAIPLLTDLFRDHSDAARRERGLVFGSLESPLLAHHDDAVLDVWLASDIVWRAYKTALRHQRYSLSQSEVVLVARAHPWRLCPCVGQHSWYHCLASAVGLLTLQIFMLSWPVGIIKELSYPLT